MKYKPYSFSKIDTFNKCKHKFKLRYIDKIKTPFEMNSALEKGRFIHKILENLFIFNMEKAFEITPKNFKFQVLSEIDRKKAIRVAYDFIMSNKDYINEIKKSKEVITEFKFKLDTKGKELVTTFAKYPFLSGVIDLIAVNDDSVRVIDWKTGKVPQQVNTLQTLIYALYVFNAYDVDKVDCEFVYVEHNDIHRVTYVRQNYDEYIKMLKIEIKKIETETDFEKNVTPLCDWCEFQQHGHCAGVKSYKIENSF